MFNRLNDNLVFIIYRLQDKLASKYLYIWIYDDLVSVYFYKGIKWCVKVVSILLFIYRVDILVFIYL